MSLAAVSQKIAVSRYRSSALLPKERLLSTCLHIVPRLYYVHLLTAHVCTSLQSKAVIGKFHTSLSAVTLNDSFKAVVDSVSSSASKVRGN